MSERTTRSALRQAARDFVFSLTLFIAIVAAAMIGSGVAYSAPADMGRVSGPIAIIVLAAVTVWVLVGVTAGKSRRLRLQRARSNGRDNRSRS